MRKYEYLVLSDHFFNLLYSQFLGVTLTITMYSLLEQRKRFGLLMAASFLEGASVGPLIEIAIDFDSRYIT